MKPLHSRRTNDTPTRHPWSVPLGALLRRVVVLSTARPASHRGIPSLPVPGRRRASEVAVCASLLLLGLAILVTPAAASPELRWIAYVRAKGEAGLSDYRGAVEVVRSDGRGKRTLIEDRVLAVDLGPRGGVFAAQEEEMATDSPPKGSVVMASVTDGPPERVYAEESGTYYYGVAASSDGDVAVIRQVTRKTEVPPFLADAVGVLRSTNLPVLVPPEEPPGTGGLVPSAEQDFYDLTFTNDPAGKLAHASQVNVFVTGSMEELHDPRSDPTSQTIDVRGTDGVFFCGASACFATWTELDVNYTVGEFGAKEEAIAFAESLVPIEALAGSHWREGKAEPTPTPELIVRDSGGSERVLQSVEGFCECGFRPLDWDSQNDRLLVLASTEGYTTLQEYRADGSGEPATVAEARADPEGLDVILDAAYGPDGVVALFGGEGGPPGTLRQLEGDESLAPEVRAFDIEGSTLAYVDGAGDVIVRDLPTGQERTVGEGAIDVSVAPDVISAPGGFVAETSPADDGFPVLPVGIALAGLTLLTGTALLLHARRRARG